VAVAVALMRRDRIPFWQPVVRALVGAALGMGLAAFYLVPATVEQKWVDIRQATGDPGEQIENSFLFGHHAGADMALHDAELHRVSWIAVVMLAAILVAMAVGWRRRAFVDRRQWWIPLALVPLGVLFLLLPVSLPVWDLLPKMRFLQFPWRWLVVLEAPLGIFVASAVQRQGTGIREQGRPGPRDQGNEGPKARLPWTALAASGAVFLGLTVFAGRMFFEVCDEYDAVPGMMADYRAGDGFQGTDEYAPTGGDNSLVAENLPAGCLVANAAAALGKTSADNAQPSWAADQRSCLAALPSVVAADANHWTARGELQMGGYLVLRLRRYPAWDVKVNGRPEMDVGHREDGLMVVPVAAGPVDVRADWRATPDVWKGRWISLASSLVLAAGLAVMTRRTRPQTARPRIE
jgi:hypothetical protein